MKENYHHNIYDGNSRETLVWNILVYGYYLITNNSSIDNKNEKTAGIEVP